MTATFIHETHWYEHKKNYENKKEKQPKKIQLKFVGTGNV